AMGGTLMGIDAYTNVYQFSAAPIGVYPQVGSHAGGYQVTIWGINLGDGTDVTNVTLCGVAAAVVSQSPTQIVVTAGAGEIGLGDVRVFSVSFGETVSSNAFTYAIAEMIVLGTNGAVIASGESAEAAKGADFGSHPVFGAYTNWLAITNSGDAALSILGVATNGSDAGFFSVHDLPASLISGGATSFRVVYAPTALGGHAAALSLSNDSTNTPYVINLAGAAIKRDQDALIFTPASPQAYGTTNALSVSGGSGTGDVSYAIVSGPGTIVGGTGLTITSGSGSVLVQATKAGDDFHNPQSVTGAVAAAKADQTISFPAVGNQLATNKVGLAATASSELGVTFSVLSGPAALAAGTNLSFTGVGTVRLLGDQAGDENWNPAPTVTNTFAVALAFADVFLGDLSQTYDGTPRVVTATTDPAGLSVDITYDGSSTAPTAAGSYSVTGSINDATYEGVQTGTLVVAKASQSIAFPIPGLKKTNDVVGLAAAASSGLPVSFDVLSGPGILSGGTNLSFTSAGIVRVVASQPGDANWLAAANVVRLFRAGVSPLWTDYDGDQISDLAVYDAAVTASWYIRKVTGDVLCWAEYIGPYPPPLALPGDYNGDGVADLAVYSEEFSQWSARTLSGEVLMFRTNWGIAGGVPVPGDYDGDGIFDLVLYDEAHGNWYARTLAGQVLMVATNWGYPGAVAVPGDYDGDGASDLAVYDQTSGNWFVRTIQGDILTMGTNWGYPGAVPVPGDYDADGIADLAVYDELLGNWYIRSSFNGPVLLWGDNWGFHGAVPVPGDYDGDGLADMAVYGMDGLAIPAGFVGNWYIRKLNGDIILMNENWGYSNTVPVNGE
ncbi:MAG TPA: MBG domain-containing protein, partial [Kiritimatiellia bacterium]|nr:MBG domain-containing protein [Kiritimatiellia bacterium]